MKETTKSSSSTRNVPIPLEFAPALEAYAEGKNILFPAPRFKKDEYMTHSSYVKFWQGIVKCLVPLAPSAESLTAHILRHNYATMLYYSDISIKMAAKLMGHSGVQMIMQIYAHLDDEKENTVDKLDSIFQKK